MATFVRRVDVRLDSSQYAALEREARATGRSIGSIVREAVTERLGVASSSKQAALARLLARADSLPSAGPIDWQREKDSFEWDLA